MKIDHGRSDAWYIAVSEFLESYMDHEDVEAPGSLVVALCRVLADAMEQVDAPAEQKLEAVSAFIAHSMGSHDIVLGKNSDSDVN